MILTQYNNLLFETCKLNEQPLSGFSPDFTQNIEFNEINQVICDDFQLKLAKFFNI